jgi:hypothetical protein
MMREVWATKENAGEMALMQGKNISCTAVAVVVRTHVGIRLAMMLTVILYYGEIKRAKDMLQNLELMQHRQCKTCIII